MANKFFKDNATVGGGDFPVVDDGVYVCRLKEIEPTKGKDFNDPSKEVDQLKWAFETMEVVDEEEKPFRFVKYTKTNYGDNRANLTILLDSMIGRRLTPDEFYALDLDDLKAKKWNVLVELTKNADGTKDINKITSVKPLKSAGASVIQRRPTPAPKVEDEIDNSDLEDPFGTDNA